MKMNLRVAVLALGVVSASSAFASLTSYSQDFEGLAIGDGAALTNDGWKVFGNVFDPGGNYLYGYGPFGAPNPGGGFSAIATGEGGPNQGLQYINTYSDYNNSNEHSAGNIVEANVFQEQIIGAGDLGQTFTFGFDFKASSGFGPGGATRTWAFIKVLDSANFSLLAFPRTETTAASTSVWSEGNTINITIDPSWTNDILQFGFMSTATNFQPSGVYYDNVSFGAVPEPASMVALGAGLLTLARKRRKA